jgi:hypothetical protein
VLSVASIRLGAYLIMLFPRELVTVFILVLGICYPLISILFVFAASVAWLLLIVIYSYI